MKRIMILLLGATLLLAPAVEAKDRHHRHRDRHHRHEYRVGRYYAPPPYYTRRHWHRGRVYTWHGNRYHWRNGAWVIYSPVGRVVVYR